MYKKSRTSVLVVCLIGVVAVISACTHQTASVSNRHDDLTRSSKQLKLTKGQMLSVITPVTRVGGERARSDYYKQVLPLAESLGLKRELQLKVTDTAQGKFKPEGVIFFTWPDQASEARLYANPNWPEMKALRPKAWQELRIYTLRLERDLALTFDADKFYTLAVAWLNPEHPTAYARYLDGIEAAANAAGGRFIYTMEKPRFEAHATRRGAPGRLTFVEWDSFEGLSQFQASEAFRQNVKYLQQGVTQFEFHRLKL